MRMALLLQTIILVTVLAAGVRCFNMGALFSQPISPQYETTSGCTPSDLFCSRKTVAKDCCGHACIPVLNPKIHVKKLHRVLKEVGLEEYNLKHLSVCSGLDLDDSPYSGFPSKSENIRERRQVSTGSPVPESTTEDSSSSSGSPSPATLESP